jgi:hypothetical protein
MEDYAKYVEGKTISAVGRARPFADQSAEIGKSDLIMVTSSFGETVTEYYSRCNITVMNRHHARLLVQDPSIGSKMAVDWVLLRTPKFHPSGKFKSRVVGGPAYFEGAGNQIPIFLNDIVRFKPDSVYVYGTDLYLSGYDTTRPSGNFYDLEKWKSSIIEHNQPKVRRYYQLMCELYPFIIPDERLDRILGMSDKKFWSELSDAWGGL